MINMVALMGRLTYEPELRTTQSGLSVLSFQVACDRSYQASGQERQADFIDCVAWRQTAEFISRYFRCASPFCGTLLVVLSGLSEEQWRLLESVCRAICRSVLHSSAPTASKAVYSQVSLDREAGNRAAESGPQPGTQAAGTDPGSRNQAVRTASRPGNRTAGTAPGTKSRSSAPMSKK